jgi:hypothetical protein
MTHTIFPGFIPEGYFSDENVQYLRSRVAELLKPTYHQTVIIDASSVIRVMSRVLEERVEPIPRMNERVLMYLRSEFINYQLEAKKHMNWEEHFIESQSLYDATTERIGYDGAIIKLANRLGKPRIGAAGAVRFMFI